MLPISSYQEGEETERSMFGCLTGKTWTEVMALIKRNPGPFVTTYKQMDEPGILSRVVNHFLLGVSDANGRVPFDSEFLDYSMMVGDNPSTVGNLRKYFEKSEGFVVFGEKKKITEVSFVRDDFESHLMMLISCVWSTRLESRIQDFVPKDDVCLRDALLSEEELRLHVVLKKFVHQAEKPAVAIEFEKYLDFLLEALQYWQKRERELVRSLAAATTMIDRYQEFQQLLRS